MSSVTRAPSKAVRRNEMPFGRDTRVVPSNTVLDRPRHLTGTQKREIWGSEPPDRSDVAYCQIILALVTFAAA